MDTGRGEQLTQEDNDPSKFEFSDAPEEVPGDIDQLFDLLNSGKINQAQLKQLLVQRDQTLLNRNQQTEERAQRAEQSATRDARTGLLNERGFKEQANTKIVARLREITGAIMQHKQQLGRELSPEEEAQVEAEIEAQKGALYLGRVDCDDFKRINDYKDEHGEVLGHDEGDRVLRQVGKVLMLATRAGTDVVGRTGGDEFNIVLDNIHPQDLERVIRRVPDIYYALQQPAPAPDSEHPRVVGEAEAEHALGNYRQLSTDEKQIMDQGGLLDDSFPVRVNQVLGQQTLSIGITKWRRGISLEQADKECDGAAYAAKDLRHQDEENIALPTQFIRSMIAFRGPDRFDILNARQGTKSDDGKRSFDQPTSLPLSVAPVKAG